MRSLSNPPDSTQDVGVCSLSWEDSPGHARLVSTVHLDDDLDVPLQHASFPSFTLSLARHDGKQARQPTLNTAQISLDDTATFSKADQKQYRMVSGRNVTLSPRAGISPRLSICGTCEDKTVCSRSPDPPAVSPCSSASQSCSDVSRSSSNTTHHEELLLAEIISRIPCIETGQSVFVSSTDIREIFFPGCSSPECNIVVNALKLQMKYPHIPQYMHACSRGEQMTFLQRHLHLVTSGTPLVDVEAFLKHRESLTAMIETKHIMTSDSRSIGCSITHQQNQQQRDEHMKDFDTSEKRKTKNNLLPAIIWSNLVGKEPGDCESPMEAMVPLSLLPPLFPRYHRQLLLMATGFLTGKDRRVIRKCSERESRLLNSWHRHVRGSRDQLVTTADLLVKWADVAVIVDPSMKHAVRVSNTHQRQQQQQQQLHLGRRECSPCRTPERPCGSRAQGTRRSAEQTVDHDMTPLQTSKTDADTSAVNWMPKILNYYTTYTESRSQNENSTPLVLTDANKHVSVTTKKVSLSQAVSSKSSKETKLETPQLAIVTQQEKTKKKQPTDKIPLVERKVLDSSSSSSSVESLDGAQLTVDELHDDGKALETTGKKIKCPSTKKKKAQLVRTQSLETIEQSTSSRKTPSPRCSSVQPRPRACKSRRKGTRHSERIASQIKGPSEENYPEDEADQRVLDAGEEEAVRPCRNEGKVGKKHMPPICLTPGSDCKLCKNCGEEDASPTEAKDEDIRETSTGFKKIAQLFSVLSKEEVSHRSRNVTEEIVECGKKNSSSKPRTLGDLTSKGLEPTPHSDILLTLPSTSAKIPSKKQRKDTKTTASKAGKSKSKYPELVIEAQNCLVDAAAADMPKRPNSPVSVIEIMKNMDETFNAFKNDPVELVKEKIKGCSNSTGYVNMDFIRIAHPHEGVDTRKCSKPITLPPIEKHDIGPQKKDLLSGVDISSILRTHASEKNFSILEESTTPKDNTQSTSKAISEAAPAEGADCPSGIKGNIGGETLDPNIAKDCLLGHSSSSQKDTQMQGEKAVVKPSWDIEKVVKFKGSKSSCYQGQNEDTRKQGMNAEFVAMKAKAIAISETCNITPVSSLQQEAESSKPPAFSDKKDCREDTPKPAIKTLPCKYKGESSQSRHGNKELGSSGSDRVTQERTSQLKKRQRLESSSELQPVSREELSSHISSYWSEFPVSRKDSLANNRFGKSRYPIDFFKPSTPVIMKRGKQKKTMVEQTCLPVKSSTIPFQAQGYTTWKRSPSLTLGHASSIENVHEKTTEATNRDGMLHARSLSADHFPFDNNVGRKLRVTTKPFFYRDTSDNLNTSSQHAVDNALARVNRPQQTFGNNKNLQFKDVSFSANNIMKTSMQSNVKTNHHKNSPSQSSHISRRESDTLSRSTSSPKTPFHEEARLLAAFNVQSLRRLSDQLVANEETSTRRSVSESGRRETCQLGNGEYATWNDAQQIWFVDKNINRNNNNSCLPQAEDKTKCPTTKKNPVTQEDTDLIFDVDELMANTVTMFNILKKCLSKPSAHANFNNNCNTCNSSHECQLDNIGQSNVSVNTDYEQAVYPGYGTMIKGEPIKRNILLRETLKENFFLIKEISLCICTCREVLQTTRPGEEMHFKKFLMKKYLDSVKHCPLHDERRYKRHQHELSRLFQAVNALHSASLHQSEKLENKSKSKAIPGLVKAWFKNRERNTTSCSSVKEKCLQLAAEEYLSTYVDQHYKKKMLARYELDTREKSDGDHLYKDFFLFMERYPHKIQKEVDGALAKDSNQYHPDSSQKVDREVQRHLRESGSASQQELFLNILKKAQQKSQEDQTPVKSNTKCNERRNQKFSNGNPVKENHGDKPSTSRDEPGAHVYSVCNYDEHFTNENPDVSYHGLAYVKNVCLPYVVDNGFKYVPIKIATRLLPRCCCSLVKSLLKKHPKICRTLCTWEQVGLLDSISRRLTKKVTSTGDVLLRLDSLLVHLPQLGEQLKQDHHARRSKRVVACLY